MPTPEHDNHTVESCSGCGAPAATLGQHNCLHYTEMLRQLLVNQRDIIAGLAQQQVRYLTQSFERGEISESTYFQGLALLQKATTIDVLSVVDMAEASFSHQPHAREYTTT